MGICPGTPDERKSSRLVSPNSTNSPGYGKFIAERKQFSRPSGVYIDKNDILYVADSESESVSRNHDGWKRGIRIGSAKDGKLVAFIPDPETRKRPEFTGTSAAEGVAADAQGNVYGAEVGPRALKRYVKK